MQVLPLPGMHINGNFHLLIEAIQYLQEPVGGEPIKVRPADTGAH